MITTQKIVSGLVSGILLGLGIWAFLDGVVYASDKFPWVHILPLIGSIISFICLNLVTFDQLLKQGIVKVWVFGSTTLGFVSIGGGIWITASEYPPDIANNWPGVAIVLQTTFTLFASLLFFVGRAQGANSNNKY